VDFEHHRVGFRLEEHTQHHAVRHAIRALGGDNLSANVTDEQVPIHVIDVRVNASLQ